MTDFDAGVYVLKADNGLEDTASASMTLIVYPLFPVVKITAEQTLFKPGDDVGVPCEVKTYPHPEIEWFKVTYNRGRRREKKLEPTSRVAMEVMSTGVVTTLSRLVLRNATGEDGGAYKCQAISAFYEPVSDVESISVTPGPASSCIDSPSFTHCDKIVEHKFCGNKCKNFSAFLLNCAIFCVLIFEIWAQSQDYFKFDPK